MEHGRLKIIMSEYTNVLKGVKKIPTENLSSKQSSGQCVVADLLDQYAWVDYYGISKSIEQSVKNT